jgi:hypothetical protein
MRKVIALLFYLGMLFSVSCVSPEDQKEIETKERVRNQYYEGAKVRIKAWNKIGIVKHVYWDTCTIIYQNDYGDFLEINLPINAIELMDEIQQ